MKNIIIDGIEYSLTPVIKEDETRTVPLEGSKWLNVKTGGVYTALHALETVEWTLVNVQTGAHFCYWAGWGSLKRDFVPFEGTINVLTDPTP
jgi:hypothetical protein